MLSQERQFILGRSSDDHNFFFRKHHFSICANDQQDLYSGHIQCVLMMTFHFHFPPFLTRTYFTWLFCVAWCNKALTKEGLGDQPRHNQTGVKFSSTMVSLLNMLRTGTMVYRMVWSVLVKYNNVLYIGVSEVQPMVTRTLLSNYPVTLGDRQSPPLISSGLQSFEKDTGKTV